MQLWQTNTAEQVLESGIGTERIEKLILADPSQGIICAGRKEVAVTVGLFQPIESAVLVAQGRV